MLTWARQFLQRQDHPFSDLRQIRVQLAELPTNDPLQSLGAISSWLDALAEVEALKVAERLAVAELMDEAAIGFRNKLAREYLSQVRLSKVRENVLWAALHRFWQSLSRCYMRCLDDAQMEKGGGLAHARVVLFVTRGLLACKNLIKWRLLRYSAVDGDVWRLAARFAMVAENNQASLEKVNPYSGSPLQTTPFNELRKLLVLGVSATDSLLPAQIEIASRLVDHLAEGITWQTVPSGGSSFAFDLLAGQAPCRVTPKLQSTPSLRFFACTALVPKLQALHKIAEKGSLPEGLLLGAEYPPRWVALAAEHLERHWGERPPRRRSERLAAYTRIEVIHGFANVVRHYAGNVEAPPAADADDEGEIIELTAHGQTQLGDAPSGSESWVAQNLSDGGLGALIPKTTGDWVQVGQLLSLSLGDSGVWSIGVVRRLNHVAQGQVYVGVELLSDGATAAHLRVAGFATPDAELVLVLGQPETGCYRVLTRSSTLQSEDVAELEWGGRWMPVRPEICFEQTETFDLLRLTVV